MTSRCRKQLGHRRGVSAVPLATAGIHVAHGPMGPTVELVDFDCPGGTAALPAQQRFPRMIGGRGIALRQRQITRGMLG